MAQFVASGLTTAVPTAARGPNVYATTAVQPRIIEVGVFSTVATPFYVALQRASAVGTKGAAITPIPVTDAVQPAVTTAATTHTADATLTSPPIRYARLAGDGAGVIWTFPDPGIVIEPLTTNGLVISCPSGTGQQITFYIHWIE